jgi:hypothetical protein
MTGKCPIIRLQLTAPFVIRAVSQGPQVEELTGGAGLRERGQLFLVSGLTLQLLHLTPRRQVYCSWASCPLLAPLRW